MFGHVRGAFTGATEDRPGLFEAANGGTLFLDEVGELPLDIQPKLLRVLEEGSVRRLGSIENTRVDVRIITATNRDLWRLVQDKTFREDLYYRCCVLECQILPLRQCRAEIPALVHRLLARYAPAHGAPAEITQDAMERICSYEWPGNIRELGNALCQALVYSEGQAICVHHLPRRLQLSCGTGEDVCGEGGSRRCKYAAPEDVQQERRLILEALMAEGSNRTRAAKRLRMGRSTLWAKLKQYGIA
jgi:DNA-binding NtrC family response regulator